MVSPEVVMHFLNDLYTRFDRCVLGAGRPLAAGLGPWAEEGPGVDIGSASALQRRLRGACKARAVRHLTSRPML